MSRSGKGLSLRVTLGILIAVLAAGLSTVAVGLRVRRGEAVRADAATWREAADTTAAVLAELAPDAAAAGRALARAVARSERMQRVALWSTGPGGALLPAFDSAAGLAAPPDVVAAAMQTFADGRARTAGTPSAPVQCVAVAGPGQAPHAVLAVWVRPAASAIPDLTLLLLAAALWAGVLGGTGLARSLGRIERAARGREPARSLAEVARRVESELAPDRLDARVARHVRIRTRELDARCRRQEEVLSNTAHELRTPLTVVMASLGMLREGLCDTDDERQVAIESAHAATQHLTFVINDLVDAAAADAGRLRLDLQEHAVETLLDEVAELLAPIAAARGIRLAIRPSETPTRVRCDRTRVLQVVFNLVGNALKFSGDDSEVELRAVEGPDQVRLEVLDRGIGILPARRDDLFRRFSQVHAPGSSSAAGSGLGLHLCKRLVEAMGGRIGYRERDDGPGSVFWFELPRTAIAATAAEP